MDDELERIRAQIQLEREQADRARAERDAAREREDEYDRVWWAAICECDRLHQVKDAAPTLAPFAKLAKELIAWERVDWLVEMRENFRDQINRGLDTPAGERRGELWFVEALPVRHRVRPSLRLEMRLGISP